MIGRPVLQGCWHPAFQESCLPHAREAIETTKIHSIAGILERCGPVEHRPLALRTTVRSAGLIGGGSRCVLASSVGPQWLSYLDELGELTRRSQMPSESLLTGQVCSTGTSDSVYPVGYPNRVMNPCAVAFWFSGQGGAAALNERSALRVSPIGPF